MRSKYVREVTAFFSILATFLFVFVSRLGATWSVVGVDRDTDESGVAIASCVPAQFLGDLSKPLTPVALVPGVGAGVSQAALNEDAPPEIGRRLRAGADPAAVIAALTDPGFDDESAIRQHAVVTLAGQSAGFTGADNDPVALDRQGVDVSVQGNILVSEAVVEDALSAFESTDGDLATRLVAALVAGSDAGGDSRCGDQKALFAHVVVAGPGDAADAPSVLLSHTADEGSGRNPVLELASNFDDGVRRATPPAGESGRALAFVAGLAMAAVVGVVLFIRRRASHLGSP